MEDTQRDYTGMVYRGVDKSFSAGLKHPGDLVLLFEEADPEKPSLHSFCNSNPISIPKSEFDRQFRELGRKILDMRSDWKYKHIINNDRSKLDKLEQQYEVMEAILEQVSGSFQPVLS